MRKIILIVLVAVASGYGGAFLFFQQHQNVQQISLISSPQEANLPVVISSGISHSARTIGDSNENFVEASRISTESVVYIKNV